MCPLFPVRQAKIVLLLSMAFVRQCLHARLWHFCSFVKASSFCRLHVPVRQDRPVARISLKEDNVLPECLCAPCARMRPKYAAGVMQSISPKICPWFSLSGSRLARFSGTEWCTIVPAPLGLRAHKSPWLHECVQTQSRLQLEAFSTRRLYKCLDNQLNSYAPCVVVLAA
ncbi:unnamed protein product [Protopolystoma xenopodis]|uniref:Secreted protein n=1 Tax=Protopolystoma xenopodis TaxID=117903 RepID=A0A448X415_9PLAT|nr:unnamed protein product [Protopolystoma xenopodis]